MTLHVSLPTELEQLVHHEVKSGMYGSASEVVREALRSFFGNADTELSAKEIAWLRVEMKRRSDRIDSGEDKLVDGEAFFARMEKKFE